MAGQSIDIKAGDGSGHFSGYLALPKNGTGPGLVIAQEIFGVNQNMRDVADYYAEEGYVALVPDLFWRQQPGVELDSTQDADMHRAFGFYGGFDESKGVDDLQAAINTAVKRTEELVGGLPAVHRRLTAQLMMDLFSAHSSSLRVLALVENLKLENDCAEIEV